LSTRPSPDSELGRRFPGLATLAAECLNLSWDFEYADAQDAVVSFASQFPDEVASCAAGIEALLDECSDEASRLKQLDALGWGYAPRPGQLDAFLLWARDTLRQASAPGIAAG
jgi:hypothetical protein